MDHGKRLQDAVRECEQGLDRCLVLDAAWSALSPTVRAVLGSRLVDVNLPGPSKAWGAFTGGPADTIEQITRSLVDGLFGTAHVELRPLSGSLANGLATVALTAPGETIVMPPEWAFGHKSLGQRGYPGSSGRRILEMPWSAATFGPDPDGLRDLLRRERAALVTLGLSRTLFPEPMAEVAAIGHDAGATLLYDGAHVLGLIAGGVFPNPLRAGFDVLTGSTHKTLPGPVGGIVMCRAAADLDRVAKLGDAWLSTYGTARVAALTQTLAEMAEDGSRFTRAIVDNAQRLGAALDDAGFEVLGRDRNFTATHQVLVDITGLIDPREAGARLAAGGVIASPSGRADRRLRDGRSDGWWLRLGTSVLTRLGMGAREMGEVAAILARLLRHGEDPAMVAKNVGDLAGRFTTVHYALESSNGTPPSAESSAIGSRTR